MYVHWHIKRIDKQFRESQVNLKDDKILTEGSIDVKESYFLISLSGK